MEKGDSMNSSAEKRSYGRKRLQSDNRGSAIVLVLVAMAFITILVSTLLAIGLYNYQMKMTDKGAKNNFYSAEMAMNEIKAGLSQQVSAALSDSYINVMQNYGKYTTDADRTTVFRNTYEADLTNGLKDPAFSGQSNTYRYQLTTLRGYLSPAFQDQTTVSCTLADNTANMVAYQEGILLKDIKVTYTNDKGYVSIIQTDILLKFPEIDFVNAMALPDLYNYALIGNHGIYLQDGTSIITGSLYGGAAAAATATDNGGIVVGNNSTLQIKSADYVVSGSDLLTKSGGTTRLDETSTLWTKNIVNDSSALSIANKAYVANDLTVIGNGSNITLAGSYYGYGNSADNLAASSSSILINGIHTSLDLSTLDRLVLAGKAYVAATKVNAGSGNTNTDVGMGQSVAAKSDQLAYLVPEECVGYEVTTDTAGVKTYGKCLLGKNPVYASDLQAAQTTAAAEGAALEEVYTGKTMTSMGKTLDYYGAKMQKVYYQTVNTNPWVYYFISFPSQQMADQFFRDYYTANHQKMDTYLSNYIASLKINTALLTNTTDTTAFRLYMAGNMLIPTGNATGASNVQVTEGNYNIVKDTLTDDGLKNFELNSEFQSDADIYSALCSKLVPNKTSLTADQLSKDVYQNTINEAKFHEVMTELAKTNKNTLIFTGTGGVQAAFSDAAEYTPSGADLNNIHLIVASGDVKITGNYTGLIIAKGKITLAGGARITADAKLASKAMMLSNTSPDVKVLDVFLDATSLATQSAGAQKDSTIQAMDLVTYQNWTKE